MKIEVVDNGTWTPSGAAACTADGDLNTAPSGALMAPGVPFGALIARINGSSADQGADTTTTPARIVFAVGRTCVFTVPAAPVASLYLGINDAAIRMASVAGSLVVNIFEAM